MNLLCAAEDVTPVALRFFNVVFYRVGSYISDTAIEFTTTPKVTLPVNSPQRGTLFEQTSRRYPLEQLHHLRNRNVRAKTHKQVDMVAHDLQFMNHKVILAGDLVKDLLKKTFNISIQNFITVLRTENNMKTHLPESMAHAN